MQNPSVLILLATYNGEKYIEEQITSIYQQTYRNWKIIIHDDGSKDNTINIINKFIEEDPNKIELLNDSKKFKSANKNFSHLIEYAKKVNEYQYIMFCDQDDYWNANKIEITLNGMRDYEKTYSSILPILVHTDLEVVDYRLKTIGKSFMSYNKIDPSRNSLNYLLAHNTITGCTVMVNRPLLQLYSYYEDSIMHDYWIGLIATCFGKINYIDIPTIQYRQHETNDYGVSKFNLVYLLRRLKELLNEKNTSYTKFITKQKQQAKAFLEHYQNDLSIREKAILNAFSSNNAPKISRICKAIKFEIYRNGVIRNIFFLGYQ
ncbi:MAG: glycosyltransferase family 2 protein [Campylobacterales bacterium]|nr:glycosyltransferase family 2 protein [Campylobacterales bacterium]